MGENRRSELKDLREVAGLSQYEVSKLTGIARNRLSLYECGYIDLHDEEYGLAINAIKGAIRKRQEQLRSALRREAESVSAAAV